MDRLSSDSRFTTDFSHTLINKHRTLQQIAKRAKIIVLGGEGLNNRQIMRQLDVSHYMASV